MIMPGCYPPAGQMAVSLHSSCLSCDMFFSALINGTWISVLGYIINWSRSGHEQNLIYPAMYRFNVDILTHRNVTLTITIRTLEWSQLIPYFAFVLWKSDSWYRIRYLPMQHIHVWSQHLTNFGIAAILEAYASARLRVLWTPVTHHGSAPQYNKRNKRILICSSWRDIDRKSPLWSVYHSQESDLVHHVRQEDSCGNLNGNEP